MKKRILLAKILAFGGAVVAGCLDGGRDSDGQDEPRGDGGEDVSDPDGDDGDTTGDGDGDAPDDVNEESDQDDEREPDADTDGVRETHFEILDTDASYEVSASVAFEDGMVTITGTISGNNSCYTAKLGEVTIVDRTLFVGVESYDDADEDEGCMEVLIGIDYEALIEIEGELPDTVTVEHDGEEVTTERRS